jgi:hypothetical protein
MKLFDTGGNFEDVIRRVASAKDVWLVIATPDPSNGGSSVRTNLHLAPEQIETFRLIPDLAKLDSLRTESKPSTR